MPSLTIHLPWLDASLAPNRSKGVHWAQLSAKRAKRKADARLLALQGMRAAGYVPERGMLAIDITFVCPDKRARDIDGCLSAIKHDLDGIAQALGLDDQYFEPITLRRQYGKRPGSVVVIVGKSDIEHIDK